MGENFALDSAHNFGIYTKSGKRTIFQIDFSCKRINFIERGKISKAFDFGVLEQYDTEENLHIVLRFRNNKSLEFDADTAEEKYTICRLLGIIIGAEQLDNIEPESEDSIYDEGEPGVKPRLNTKKQVLKEGVLDKKGNTKIPTWSKRRVQVSPGEFSYYKPGEEVALNLVQLWENVTSVSRSGNSGLTVAVRDRAYHFRVLSEKGVNVEQEREAWIDAFHQASQRKRTTFLLLEMANKRSYNAGKHGMPQSPDIDDNTYFNTFKNSSSGSEGSREFMEGLEAINELDEVLDDEVNEGPRPRSIALSVVKKESPVLVSPTKSRARPPAIDGLKSSFNSHDGGGVYDFIPEPDYSPPTSPGIHRDRDTSGKYANFINQQRNSGAYAKEIHSGEIYRDKQSSGKYANVIASNDQGSGGGRTSGDYAHFINQQSNAGTRQSGAYNKVIKPAPGAVDVMPKFNEIPKLRKVNSQESSDGNDSKDSPRMDDSAEYANAGINVRKFKDNIENMYINDQGIKVTPHDKRFPPPAPSKTRHAPAPPPHEAPYPHSPPADTAIPQCPGVPPPPFPAPAPPPPPMMMNGGQQRSRGKLKQVHWSRTPKPLVSKSIWEHPVDRSKCLNLKLLEEQFAVKDLETHTSAGPKMAVGKSNLLIDGKRAQNLGIFMAGLKNEGSRKLVDILNSVTEDDSFPAEKLTTIRRLQPTEDEIDMYRGYTDKRHELHPVDQFMLELCEIPHLNLRIDICLTLWDFPWQYESTCQLVEQVHGACDELLNSDMLVVVLQYILAIGNHLNRNWSPDNVTQGFQVTSLEKVLDVRGKETGYTLTHFLVDQLKTSEPSLLQWPETITTVKKCEQVSVKSVAAESEVLRGDLIKIKRHLKTLRAKNVKSTRQDNKFQQDVQNLVVEYEFKLEQLDRRCGDLHTKYRQLLTRFGEPMYQKSDQMFAVIATFADRFKNAVTDLDSKKFRKPSIS